MVNVTRILQAAGQIAARLPELLKKHNIACCDVLTNLAFRGTYVHFDDALCMC